MELNFLKSTTSIKMKKRKFSMNLVRIFLKHLKEK